MNSVRLPVEWFCGNKQNTIRLHDNRISYTTWTFFVFENIKWSREYVHFRSQYRACGPLSTVRRAMYRHV
jgi:hypothetical protein